MKLRFLWLSLLVLVAGGATHAQALQSTSPVGARTVMVGDVNSPNQLFSAILNAHKAGANTIIIAPGEYHIETGPGHYAWKFEGISNLTVNAPAVTLVFSDTAYEMMNFLRCKNIVFRGATITGPPNFTQGQVVGADKDERGHYMDVVLDAGYPTDWNNTEHWDKRAAFQVFDATTRRFKPATGDYDVEMPPTVLDATTHKYRFYLGRNSDLLPANGRVANGDFVGIRGHAGRFWNVDGCSNIKFQDVTVDAANTNMWESGSSLDVAIDRCNFVYQRAPIEGGVRGLLGPTGILSGNNINGLVVTDTLWQGADDDIINSDAGTLTIGKSDGSKLTCRGTSVSKGDALSLYDVNGSFIGRAVVLNDPVPTEPPTDATDKRDWRFLTLDKILNLPTKSYAYNINHTSLNFTMRNCVFQNFRDVGLIICGENAVIENCVFDAGTVCAIVCEGYANNLIIRNNVFSNNGFRWDYDNTDGGRNAGTIQMDKRFYNRDARGQTFQNTLIQNNTFIANAGIDIALNNAVGARIEGNTFIDSHPQGPRPLRDLRGMINSQDSNSHIWLQNDRDVTLKSNAIVNAGRYANKVVGQGEGNSAIQGSEGGIVTRTAQLYEAEKAAITQAHINTGGSASSGKFVSGLTQPGSRVQFTVQTAQAGRYALVMAYDNASRDEAGSSLMATQTVLVNGIKAATIFYPYTGFWAQFHPTYASSVVVSLRAGSNSIEFRHDSQSVELDTLRLVPLG